MSGEVPTDVPPAAFGRFRVLHQIGVGSLGPVFRGEDADTGVAVAIKQLRVSLAPERAAQVAAALEGLVAQLPRHPAIVPVIDAGVHQGAPYLVTAFATADSLDTALREYGPASIADATPRLRRLAEALDRAAARDVVHGALHPRDILIAAEETFLTGLGVVSALGGANVRQPARRPYAAPEVVAGDRPVGASDQYALAAIAYEWLFGGRAPRSAESTLDAPRLEGVDNDALKSALMRALAADPDARFASSSAFVAAIADSFARRRAVPVAPAVVEPLPLPLTLDDEDADPTDVFRPQHVDEVRQLSVGRAADPPAMAIDVAHERTANTLAGEPVVEGDVAARPESPASAAAPLPAPASSAPMPAEPHPPAVDAFSPERELRSVVEPPPPVEPFRIRRDSAAPVAWQGSLGRSDAELQSSTAESRSRGGLLAATLVGGIAIGGLVGYLYGTGTFDPARSIADTQDPEAQTAGEAEKAAGRDFTEAPVTANAPPATERKAPDAASPAAPSASAASAPKRPPVESPRLLIRSTPAGATVSVDGTARGRTPLTLRDLPLGTRAISVSRPGYVAVQRRITLTNEAPAQSLEIQLTPVAPRTPASRTVSPDAPGSLVIDSRPSGATVTMDGKPIGVTPVTIATLAAGSHTVRLELPDHRPWTATFILKPGEKRRIGASLETGRDDE